MVSWDNVLLGVVVAGLVVCCAWRVWLILCIEGLLLTDCHDQPREPRRASIVDPFSEIRWARTLEASGHAKLGSIARSLRRVLVGAFWISGALIAILLTRAWL